MAALLLAAAVLAHAADRGLSPGRSTALGPSYITSRTLHVNYLLSSHRGTLSRAAARPTLLFLHGSEQRGDNPSMLEDLAILAFADRVGGFPFVAILPQCPTGERWSPGVLRQVLDAVESNVPVDHARVYLTGFSMGAFGTWQTAAAIPGGVLPPSPPCADSRTWRTSPG